jgi:dTDP-4-amino-4,6-dideoxygalactose transaminase
MIPFSPPYISEAAIKAVNEVLRSGWITTGPVTKKFEQKITDYCGNKKTLCVNSATAGLELVLRWFGVGPGDEVIIPAYTYCATANVILHCGATPVMVDSDNNDVNIATDKIKQKITKNTKVIIPVDVCGFPCGYDEINAWVKKDEVKKLFEPKNDLQKKLGRILVMSDAAHSFGATYKGKRMGIHADITVFSFHAVKNLTTAEGGAVALNLPDPFSNDEIYQQLNTLSLHGQSKDALAKTVKKGWRYDVAEAGYKMNMTDIQAALGIAQLDEYDVILAKRRHIFRSYSEKLDKYNWALLPVSESRDANSSYHVYGLRIKNINEEIRDSIIDAVLEKDVAVNVHFQPLPLLTCYKNLGYRIRDFPNAYNHYSCEISLPVFYAMTDEQVNEVLDTLARSVGKILDNA